METNKRKSIEEQREECHRMTALWIVAVVALVVALCTGCKSVEYVNVPVHSTDTLYINRVEHDSIHVHDSIRITERGDTIRIDRWHTKYVEVMRHDTIYQSKTDTVPVPYPVTEYVEKQLTWWQRTKMNAGVVLIILIGGAALFGLYKLLHKLGIINF